ncbi:hypothetical protein SAMN05444355_10749 [Flavobacterium frigoris]|uniref:Uncharacterized protein n=1 Tax=Flavobacterium frigoris TaxID=229204 RepID=A0A1H9LJN9_FLAFI|nr:hypothetical protein SAMN05444355_10749 [Flavobacterium frigoris]
MSINKAKLRFFALMWRLCELEKQRRFKIDLEYHARVEQFEREPLIYIRQNEYKEPVFYEYEGSRFISKPKHNFKKR